MAEKSRFERFFFLAAIAVIVVAPMQWSFRLPLPGTERGANVTLADVLVLLAFGAWALGVLLHLWPRRLRMPTPGCVALVAAVGLSLLSVLQGSPKGEGFKELLQYVEYFLLAFVLLSNAIAGRAALQRAVGAFTLAASAVVVIALWQYFGTDSFFNVRGSFGNRNVLSVYLALALPVVFGVALYQGGCFMRMSLMATVAVGVAVCLSGGPLIGLLIGLGVISALRGRVFLVVMIFVALLGGLVAPHAVRPHHGDALVASVSPAIDNNYLLSHSAMLRRAEELVYGRGDVLDRFVGEITGLSSNPSPLAEAAEALKATHTADARRAMVAALGEAVDQDKSIEKAKRKYWAKELRVAEDCERYNDARRLLEMIRSDLEAGKAVLNGPELLRYAELYALCKQKTQKGPIWEHPGFGRPILARRYTGWIGAVAAIRKGSEDSSRAALFGRGAGSYEREVIKGDWFAGLSKLKYDTDEPEVFNLGCDEADTFSQWLVTMAETGAIGLACLIWVWLGGLGKAARVWSSSKDSFSQGLALGLIGSFAAFAVCAVFSGVIVRGVAVPFVFLLVCADLMRRFEMEVYPE